MQNIHIVCHLPSHIIKTDRQNIGFLTPNNDELHKYTSFIYIYIYSFIISTNIDHEPTERQVTGT